MSEEASRAALLTALFEHKAHRPRRSPRFDRVEDICARSEDKTRDRGDDLGDEATF